ncbi:MAG: AMP-binding protein, partial [Candidatus Eremiobacteraeota bacterium]|nr:AMP-binding protein [Candidatus Eremiobacteraeota bacterium]
LTGEATMPKTSLPNVHCYETLLAEQPNAIEWPVFDERTASSLCYTSGTTGDPKGVLYSHRSTILHSLSGVGTDQNRRVDRTPCALPLVPMFHVNGWGFPYTAPMMGAKLVLPGMGYEGKQIYELMESEKVTSAGGVPTIWYRLLAYLEETGAKLSTLQFMKVGGSASPPALIEAFESRGVEVVQGWGMTETSPVCSSGCLPGEIRDTPERLSYQLKAGHCLYGVEMKIVDPTGETLPNDGVAVGELCVRGPWVASAYYENPQATELAFTADGWFRTGDLVSINPDGYLTITDRAKDLIKSGGEWISSIDLENVALRHPDVEEVAAIALPHPQWGERPMLVVRRRAGTNVDRDDIVAFLTPKVAGWWLPDEIAFVDEMPYTATGKISKKTLRERYARGAQEAATS